MIAANSSTEKSVRELRMTPATYSKIMKGVSFESESFPMDNGNGPSSWRLKNRLISNSFLYGSIE